MQSKRTRHAAYNVNYHFVWIPKFRRPVLVGGIPSLLERIIREEATKMSGEVLDITVRPDHVHLFCSFPPTFSPQQIMHQLKGVSAHQLREAFPALKSRLPNLWTRSYYVGTAGHVSAQTIRRYIEEQRGK